MPPVVMVIQPLIASRMFTASFDGVHTSVLFCRRCSFMGDSAVGMSSNSGILHCRGCTMYKHMPRGLTYLPLPDITPARMLPKKWTQPSDILKTIPVVIRLASIALQDSTMRAVNAPPPMIRQSPLARCWIELRYRQTVITLPEICLPEC